MSDIVKITTSSKIEYRRFGKYHRLDGPAVEWYRPRSNIFWWFVNGRRYIDNKSYQAAANLSDDEMLLLVLTYENVT